MTPKTKGIISIICGILILVSIFSPVYIISGLGPNVIESIAGLIFGILAIKGGEKRLGIIGVGIIIFEVIFLNIVLAVELVGNNLTKIKTDARILH